MEPEPSLSEINAHHWRINPNNPFRFPYDIVYVIAHFLKPRELMALAKTCRWAYTAATEELVWEYYFEAIVYQGKQHELQPHVDVPWSYRWSFIVKETALSYIHKQKEDTAATYDKNAAATWHKSIEDLTLQLGVKVTQTGKNSWERQFNRIWAHCWKELYYRTTNDVAREWAYIKANQHSGHGLNIAYKAATEFFQEAPKLRNGNGLSKTLAKLLSIPPAEEEQQKFLRNLNYASIGYPPEEDRDFVINALQFHRLESDIIDIDYGKLALERMKEEKAALDARMANQASTSSDSDSGKPEVKKKRKKVFMTRSPQQEEVLSKYGHLNKDGHLSKTGVKKLRAAISRTGEKIDVPEEYLKPLK